MTIGNDTYDIWRAGFVNRWHTFTDPRLRNSDDTVAAHSWRVALLVHRLQPSYSDLVSLQDICVALYHDVDELATGDHSYTFKRIRPDIAEETARYGRGWLDERGVPEFEVSALVKLCDRLDAYLFAASHAPEIVSYPAWTAMRADIMEAARALDLAEEVYDLMEAPFTSQGKF